MLNFSIPPLLPSVLNLLVILASPKLRTYITLENVEINEDDIHLIIKNLKCPIHERDKISIRIIKLSGEPAGCPLSPQALKLTFYVILEDGIFRVIKKTAKI